MQHGGIGRRLADDARRLRLADGLLEQVGELGQLARRPPGPARLRRKQARGRQAAVAEQALQLLPVERAKNLIAESEVPALHAPIMAEAGRAANHRLAAPRQ